MVGTSRDISSVMTSAANNYNTNLDSSVRIKTRILNASLHLIPFLTQDF